MLTFPRRQQYRRLRRAAASGAAGVVAGALAVIAASASAIPVAGVLVLVMVGLLIDARRWARLAGRSRIGAHSEDEVRRTLAALEAERVAATPLAALQGARRHRQRRDRADRDRVRDQDQDPNVRRAPPRRRPGDGGMALQPTAAPEFSRSAPRPGRRPRQRLGARPGRGPDRVDRPPRAGAPSRSRNIPAARVPGHKAAHVAARRDRQPAARHLPPPAWEQAVRRRPQASVPRFRARGTGRRTPPSHQRGRQSRDRLDSQQPMNRSAPPADRFAPTAGTSRAGRGGAPAPGAIRSCAITQIGPRTGTSAMSPLRSHGACPSWRLHSWRCNSAGRRAREEKQSCGAQAARGWMWARAVTPPCALIVCCARRGRSSASARPGLLDRRRAGNAGRCPRLESSASGSLAFARGQTDAAAQKGASGEGESYGCFVLAEQ